MNNLIIYGVNHKFKAYIDLYFAFAIIDKRILS